MTIPLDDLEQIALLLMLLQQTGQVADAHSVAAAFSGPLEQPLYLFITHLTAKSLQMNTGADCVCTYQHADMLKIIMCPCSHCCYLRPAETCPLYLHRSLCLYMHVHPKSAILHYASMLKTCIYLCSHC